ncbi:MAG: hypothetical protein R3D28_20235 [Geminicoccaceae bacterium]
MPSRLGCVTVVESTRVLDAGIAAGLELDRPQLLERHGLVRVNLTAGEVIAIVDGRGASSPAAIPPRRGCPRPLAGCWGWRGAVAALPPTTDEQLVITRPVQSLGAPAGLVVACFAGRRRPAPRGAP